MKNTTSSTPNASKSSWFVYVLIFFILAFFAFQYALITRGFPTGDDPAVHIYAIKTLSYSGLLHTSYPLPLIIFKFLKETTGFGYPLAFVFTISLYFFISVVALFYFARKVTVSNLAGFAAATVFALGLWAVDGLRMGLLAETFGWGIFLLTLLFLALGNIPLTLVFSGILLASHPFSFTIFVLVFILYFLTSLFVKHDRMKVLILAGIYGLAILLSILFVPSLISHFKDFINPEVIGWGERKLWDILISSDLLRAVGLLFAVIGVVAAAKDWQKPGIRLSYILLFVGLFMSMNQIFGIRFLVFRFYPYLEMAITVFIGLGLKNFIDRLEWRRQYASVFGLVLLAMIAYPHFRGSRIITSSQVNDPLANDIMTTGDREAFDWIQQNIDPVKYSVNVPYKRLIWLKALTDNRVVEDTSAFTDTPQPDYTKNYDYIYYPEINKIPSDLNPNYELVYDKDGVRIYKTLKTGYKFILDKAGYIKLVPIQ